MPSPPPLRDLLDRFALLLRADDRRTEGLLPIHRSLLRFLDRANRYSNTPSAAALYLGQTRGTVSQSVALLVRRGLVKKTADAADGRRVRLQLTARGRRRAAEHATGTNVALAGLSPDLLRDVVRVLDGMVRAMEEAAGGRSFGTCGTCRWYRSEPGGARCGLTREVLSPAETGQICVLHARRDPEARPAEA